MSPKGRKFKHLKVYKVKKKKCIFKYKGFKYISGGYGGGGES